MRTRLARWWCRHRGHPLVEHTAGYDGFGPGLATPVVNSRCRCGVAGFTEVIRPR